MKNVIHQHQTQSMLQYTHKHIDRKANLEVDFRKKQISTVM